jgi:hypothetical protein
MEGAVPFLGAQHFPLRQVGHIAQSCVIFITPPAANTAHLWDFPTEPEALGAPFPRRRCQSPA